MGHPCLRSPVKPKGWATRRAFAALEADSSATHSILWIAAGPRRKRIPQNEGNHNLPKRHTLCLAGCRATIVTPFGLRIVTFIVSVPRFCHPERSEAKSRDLRLPLPATDNWLLTTAFLAPQVWEGQAFRVGHPPGARRAT